jgi:hypothetical protein
METTLSDERVNEIRKSYFDYKKKMQDVIIRVSLVYFSKWKVPNASIECMIGSLMKWANASMLEPDERNPENMVSIPIIMKINLENLLKNMVSHGFLVEETAKRLNAKYDE